MVDMEKMIQEALDSTKSAHKRIDHIEKRQEDLEKLTAAVAVVQANQENLEEDVGEIKEDEKSWWKSLPNAGRALWKRGLRWLSARFWAFC